MAAASESCWSEQYPDPLSAAVSALCELGPVLSSGLRAAVFVGSFCGAVDVRSRVAGGVTDSCHWHKEKFCICFQHSTENFRGRPGK